MRVRQFARHSLAAAVAAVALAACSQDTGPTPFNPQGASADVAAAQEAFTSPQSASFAAMGGDISTVLGSAAASAGTAVMTLLRPLSGSVRYAEALTRLLPPSGAKLQASVATLPPTMLGTTFVWDTATDAYVASDLAGAPATAVRFMLYAIDPVTLRPAEPLNEVGYVDIFDIGTATSTGFRVRVVSGQVVYLDYSVSATSSGSGGLVSIYGYVWNGSVRANFDLKNTISQTSTGLVIGLDYDLSVPERDVTLNWSATFANISDTEVAATLDLVINGPNGNVRLVGTYGASGGTFTVKVNGEPFATVTLDGDIPVITGAEGQPLTADEEETLRNILDYYDQSLSAFSSLLAPLS